MTTRTLKDIFVAPPISVLDVKQAYWKARKSEWLALGIKSELGRDEGLLEMSPLMQTKHKSTSVFDPVLAECMYHWFTKKEDLVFDPFAGGSVRGIVASILQRKYLGYDIREEQILHNRVQAEDICDLLPEWDLKDSVTNKPESEVDFIFTCPPYYGLEKYSTLSDDLSTMSPRDFETAFSQVISNSCSKLKNDRFAAIVIGDVRDGHFYNKFYSVTVDAFESAGCRFYNDLVLLQEPATAAMRAFKFMNSSRKIAKCHQNVLVFCKGDPIKATTRLPTFSDDTDIVRLKTSPLDNLFEF